MDVVATRANEIAKAACGTGALCRDPVDGREAGSCELCKGVARRVLYYLAASTKDDEWNTYGHLIEALKKSEVALDTAEVVIDADAEVEAFHLIQSARSIVKSALASTVQGRDDGYAAGLEAAAKIARSYCEDDVLSISPGGTNTPEYIEAWENGGIDHLVAVIDAIQRAMKEPAR